MTPDEPNKPVKASKKTVGQPPLAYYQRALARYLDRSAQQSQLISRALTFSYQHHLGYFRRSGEPYFNHPMSVAEILIRELKIKDPELIAAAFLHDLVEDVPAVTLVDIETDFGKTVACNIELYGGKGHCGAEQFKDDGNGRGRGQAIGIEKV